MGLGMMGNNSNNSSNNPHLNNHCHHPSSTTLIIASSRHYSHFPTLATPVPIGQQIITNIANSSLHLEFKPEEELFSTKPYQSSTIFVEWVNYFQLIFIHNNANTTNHHHHNHHLWMHINNPIILLWITQLAFTTPIIIFNQEYPIHQYKSVIMDHIRSINQP